MAMKIPPKPTAKGGTKVPEGARHTPGSVAYRQVQQAPRPKPVTIDKSFVADPRGGPELKVGKSHVEVRDNRSDPLR
jgi:hypothetical protein